MKADEKANKSAVGKCLDEARTARPRPKQKSILARRKLKVPRPGFAGRGHHQHMERISKHGLSLSQEG